MDPDKRVMTIKLDNGKKKTLNVDKSVKDLGFTLGDRVQVSYAQEIIVMAECSDKGATQRAAYGAVDVEAEGEKPALVKVDTSEIELEFRNLEASRHYLFALSPMFARSPVHRPHAIIKNNPSYEITSRPEGWLKRIMQAPPSGARYQPRDDIPTSLLLIADSLCSGDAMRDRTEEPDGRCGRCAQLPELTVTLRVARSVLFVK